MGRLSLGLRLIRLLLLTVVNAGLFLVFAGQRGSLDDGDWMLEVEHGSLKVGNKKGVDESARPRKTDGSILNLIKYCLYRTSLQFAIWLICSLSGVT